MSGDRPLQIPVGPGDKADGLHRRPGDQQRGGALALNRLS